MVASIGAVASPSQGVSCHKRDRYHANDQAANSGASRRPGGGAANLGLLSGPVDPDALKEMLEGREPHGAGQRSERKQKETAPCCTVPARI